MRKLFMTALSVLLFGGLTTEAQVSKETQLKHIREMYAQAKQQIDANGKDGRAPLDMTIRIDNGEAFSDDLVMNDVTELRFFFNKYRINTDLDYPDASACYFITEQWGANGHTRYREVLFDPNEGVLLFSYLKAETHAGFTVETRYYYVKATSSTRSTVSTARRLLPKPIVGAVLRVTRPWQRHGSVSLNN